MSELRRAIAIDFDGCLCKNMWPNIGLPNFDAINAAIRAKQKGAALILWTCRVGDSWITPFSSARTMALSSTP